jgi:FAD/FMN-containing dehydrogenase
MMARFFQSPRLKVIVRGGNMGLTRGAISANRCVVVAA